MVRGSEKATETIFLRPQEAGTLYGIFRSTGCPRVREVASHRARPGGSRVCCAALCGLPSYIHLEPATGGGTHLGVQCGDEVGHRIQGLL